MGDRPGATFLQFGFHPRRIHSAIASSGSRESQKPRVPSGVGTVALALFVVPEIGGRITSRAGDQHRHVELMPHSVNGLAEQQVAHQAVAMRTDDQEIDGIFPEVAHELARGVGAVEQNRASTIAALAEGLNQFVQVTCIRAGFPVGGVGAVDPGNRGIDHVQEHEIGPLVVVLRQAQGAIEDFGIGLSVLQRHTDARQRTRPERLDPVEIDTGRGPPCRRRANERLDRDPEEQARDSSP